VCERSKNIMAISAVAGPYPGTQQSESDVAKTSNLMAYSLKNSSMSERKRNECIIPSGGECTESYFAGTVVRCALWALSPVSQCLGFRKPNITPRVVINVVARPKW